MTTLWMILAWYTYSICIIYIYTADYVATFTINEAGTQISFGSSLSLTNKGNKGSDASLTNISVSHLACKVWLCWQRSMLIVFFVPFINWPKSEAKLPLMKVTDRCIYAVFIEHTITQILQVWVLSSCSIAACPWPYIQWLETHGHIGGSRGWNSALERRPRVGRQVVVLFLQLSLLSCVVSKRLIQVTPACITLTDNT